VVCFFRAKARRLFSAPPFESRSRRNSSSWNASPYRCHAPERPSTSHSHSTSTLCARALRQFTCTPPPASAPQSPFTAVRPHGGASREEGEGLIPQMKASVHLRVGGSDRARDPGVSKTKEKEPGRWEPSEEAVRSRRRLSELSTSEGTFHKVKRINVVNFEEENRREKHQRRRGTRTYVFHKNMRRESRPRNTDPPPPPVKKKHAVLTQFLHINASH